MVREKTIDSSLRLVSGLEVVSVVSSLLLSIWGLVPLLPRRRDVMALPLVLSLGLIFWSKSQRGESLSDLGVTLAGFRAAMKLLTLPMIAATGLLLSIGRLNGSLHLYDKFALALVLLPLSGIAQQFLLQGFIHRRLDEAFAVRQPEAQLRRRWMAILVTAAIFSLVHAPNFPLMVLTAIGGVAWSWVYDRAPNVFAVGLTHGLMSLVVICTLPPWLLDSLAIGYKTFLYRSF